jgi:hypothetical protein
MLHPDQESMDVSFYKFGFGLASKAGIVIAVDPVASKLFGYADNIAQQWRRKEDDAVNGLVVLGFPKQTAYISAKDVP